MKQSIHVRLDDEVLLRLDGYARARGLTRTAMLQMLIMLFDETARGGRPPHSSTQEPHSQHPINDPQANP